MMGIQFLKTTNYEEKAPLFSLNILANKLLYSILRFLPLESFGKVAQTCKHLNAIVYNPSIPLSNIHHFNTKCFYKALEIDYLPAIQLYVKITAKNKSLIRPKHRDDLESFKNKREILAHIIHEDRFTPSMLQYVLLNVIAHGELKSFEKLFEKFTNPCPLIDYIFLAATKAGQIDIIQKILERIVVSIDCKNEAIIIASKKGYLPILKKILEDRNVDPTSDHNDAIIQASLYGHIVIVQELLEHKADPTDQNHLAVLFACKKGHTDVLKLLLEQEGVNPFIEDGYALKVAQQHGYQTIIDILLKHPRFPASKFKESNSNLKCPYKQRIQNALKSPIFLLNQSTINQIEQDTKSGIHGIHLYSYLLKDFSISLKKIIRELIQDEGIDAAIRWKYVGLINQSSK
jgi:hypothetical protein